MRAAGTWLALAGLLLAGCAPGAGPPAAPPAPAAAVGAAAPVVEAVEPLPIHIGYAAPSASFAPVWIAQDAGLYAKHGLRADVVNLGPNGAAPLIGGDVDVVQVAGPSVFAANLEGGDTLWILVPLNRSVLYLMARPEIARGEDLRDRAVGVSARGTYTDQFMRLGLRRFGLEADRDVTVLATGGPPESVAATTTGRVAAMIAGPPANLRAQEAGLHTILDLSTLDVAYPAAGVATTRKVLRERYETLRRFARAYVEAIYLFRTDAALAQEVIGRYTATTSTTDLAESYRAFRDLTELVPTPRLEAMQTALDLMSADLPRAREADPHDFYDDSLVRELESSGFIAGLGR
jgi:NitT/TauT family transport system substrate-binding protein